MFMRFCIFVVATLVPLSASAQPPSQESLTGKLKSGDTVYLLDSTSREITGVFGKFSGSTMTLMVNGELENVSLVDIRQIARRGGDPLWNGFLIGGIIGGIAGGASTEHVGAGIAAAILYGGIGALIDKVIEGRVVIYRATGGKAVALAPILNGDRRGVRVALRF